MQSEDWWVLEAKPAASTVRGQGRQGPDIQLGYDGEAGSQEAAGRLRVTEAH